jgi:hypothetical protein
MKRIILLAIIHLITKQIQSQNYLNETARWVQTYSWSGFTANTQCTTTYYFSGDSVLNDTTYMKLFQESLCYYTHTEYDSLWQPYQLIDTSFTTSFHSLIREVEKKIYRRNASYNEYQLYNFALPDTSRIDSVVNGSTCSLNSVYILDHDTVCIGSIGRKRWRVSQSSYPLAMYIIEGVGPSSGFLAPVCRNGCPECGYSLQSFTLNGDTLYHGICEISAGIKPIDQRVKFGQNQNSLWFDMDDDSCIELYDLLGKRKISQVVKKASRTSISMMGLDNGIYLYRIVSGTQIMSGKILYMQ